MQKADKLDLQGSKHETTENWFKMCDFYFKAGYGKCRNRVFENFRT